MVANFGKTKYSAQKKKVQAPGGANKFLRPPRGLIFTKLMDLVSLLQSHHKLIVMYGVLLRGSGDSRDFVFMQCIYQESQKNLKILISIYMEGPPPNSNPCTRMHLILEFLGVEWVHICWCKFQAKFYARQEQYIDICWNGKFLNFKVSKLVKSLLSLPLKLSLGQVTLISSF